MPITNPWLAGPTPDGNAPQELLEDRILELLSTQNMAVVVTVAIEGSQVATPVRLYSMGFEVVYTRWNASPKSCNPRRDP